MGVALIATLALLGCGREGSPEDGGADAPPMRLEPAAPMPPAAAALPVMTPCPEGWAERETPRGATYCEPFPDGTPRCEGASALLPGTSGCTPIGSPCPAGELPAGLPSDRAVAYVLQGATGGDGSRARPFGSIGDAARAVPDGGIIAIGKGSYDVGSITIDRSVELVGACASETRLLGSGAEPAIAVSGAYTFRARDLRITHPFGAAIELRGISSADISGIFVERARFGVSILESVGVVTIEGSLFRDVADTRDGFGVGLALLSSKAVLRDVVFDGAPFTSIRSTSSEIDMERVAVFDDSGATTVTRYAFDLVGGRIGIRSAAFERTTGGVLASDATFEASDLFFRDIPASSLLALQTLSGSARRIAAIDVAGFSITLFDGPFRVEDLLLRGVTPIRSAPDEDPAAVVIGRGARLQLTRAVIEDSTVAGVSIDVDGAWSGSDVTIRGIVGGERIARGFGIGASQSLIEMQRVDVRECTAAGIILDDGSRARFDDLSIVDIGSGAQRSMALGVNDGASFRGERIVIERGRSIGIALTGANSALVASDVVVRDVLPSDADRDYGRGLEVADRARVELDRARIERVRDYGVLVGGGAQAALRDIAIDSVSARECENAECLEHPGGIGLGAYGSAVEVERFALRRASLCGIHFAESATVSLHEGVVGSSSIGVCVDGAGDTSALGDGVAYEDNVTNLDTVQVPVPTPLPPLEVGE